MMQTPGPTRVKICGITTPDDRDMVVEAGASAIGVISGVTVDTPREVDTSTAASLIDDIPPFVASVLVTMADTDEAMVDRIETVRPDVVQIHGEFSARGILDLSRRIDPAVVAAVDPTEIPFSDGETSLDAYADAADALLVDSHDSEGGGGTGRTHDWERTGQLVEQVAVPTILAGGLTPANVVEAVETVDPFAVDVATGVESTPGRKDRQAVSQFVSRAGRTRTEAIP